MVYQQHLLTSDNHFDLFCLSNFVLLKQLHEIIPNKALCSGGRMIFWLAVLLTCCL